MARPKKPRYSKDGIELVDNLYVDSRNRPKMWRYLRPDGSFKGFTADSAEEANRLATEANAARDRILSLPKRVPSRDSFLYHAEKYITQREELDPQLPSKQNWRNRRYALRQFAKRFSDTPVNRLTRERIQNWWDGLTYHQQGLRHTELRRFFNHLMGSGLTPQLTWNPFSTNDDKPRLYRFYKPPVARERLTLAQFWAIYRQAGLLEMPALQIAMGISLLTTMRRGDICALRLDTHITGNIMRRIIGKSEAQRGQNHAARLEWDLTADAALARLVQRGRELSMKHYRCPFLLSHDPLKRRKGKTKEHYYQVTEDRLSKMFYKARDATGLFLDMPKGRTPPTFHEIRALSSAMFGRAGYDISKIQELMAHTDEDVTRLYQSGQELPYVRIDMMLTPEVLGGSF